MKRIIAVFLMIVTLLSLSACTGEEESSDSSALQTESVTEESSSEESSEEIMEFHEMSSSAADPAETSSGETASKSNYTGSFDFEAKTVLLNSGYTMPILGLGTYSLDYDTCVNSVKTLLQNGGRLIDTAYMYGNEDAVGEGVRLAMEEYDIPREDIFVITKIYPSQFDDPEAAIDMALEKLDIGYIDMMLLHHPGTNDVEAYLAMEKYVEQGKIRSLGLSNWYVEELTEFLPQINITGTNKAKKSCLQAVPADNAGGQCRLKAQAGTADRRLKTWNP